MMMMKRKVSPGPMTKEGPMSESAPASNLQQPASDRLYATVRLSIRRDIRAILEIERASFAKPWTEVRLVRNLRRRNCISMVAEYREDAIGHMIYALYKQSIQLLTFAVAPEFRRHGIGRQMIEKLIYKLSVTRRTRIEVKIRETNLEGQLFFRALGFRAEKVLRRHWPKFDEDAYRMVYRYRGKKRLDEPFTLTG